MKTNHKNSRVPAYYSASLILERPIMTKMLRIFKSPNLLDLYLHLTACSMDSGYTAVTTRELVNVLNIKSTQTVRRLLKKLNKWNVIDIYRVHGMNVYVINPYLFWHAKSKEVRERRTKWDKVNNLSHAKNGYQQMRKLNFKYVNEYKNLRKQSCRNSKYYRIEDDFPQIISKRIAKNQQKRMDLKENPKKRIKIRRALKRDAKKKKFSPKKELVINYVIDKMNLDTNGLQLTNKVITRNLPVGSTTVSLAIQQACRANLLQRHYDRISINANKLNTVYDRLNN